MYICFKTIELQNFGSVGHAMVDITPGIFHVKGVNEDNDNSRSNGSGKSTIFSESFRWIIYGSTSKKLSSDGVINDKVNKDCFGKAKITITDDTGDEQEIEIHRYRKDKTHGNALQFYVDGRNETRQKMTDTQAEIERTLGLPLNVFSSVYLMEQGLGGKFTSMSNVESKTYIESLRNTKVWDTCYFRANNHAKKKAGNLATVEAVHGQNKAVIAAKGIDSFTATQQLATLSEDSNLAAMHKSFTNAKELYTKGVKKLETDKATLDILKTKVDPALKAQSDAYAASARLTGIQSELSKQQSGLNSRMGNLTCTACGRDFDNKEEAEKHLKAEQEILRVNIDKNQEDIKYFGESLKTVIAEYNRHRLAYEGADSAYKRYRDKVLSWYNEMLVHKSEASKVQSNLELVRKSIAAIQKEITELEQSNVKVTTQLELLEAELPYYRELVNIFSFKGIRSYLINNDLGFLNEKLREFSSYLFSDMIIQLFPNLDKKGMVVSIDTLALTNTHQERPYSKLSGGERRRADICIQLSIREFVRRIYNVDTNLFSLDEIFDGLDSEGAYTVMELIDEVSNTDTTIFIISHRSISHFSGDTISVTKEAGFTKITE